MKRHKGVSPKHQGVERLSLWIQNRLRQNPKTKFPPAELLELAKAWIPEGFEGFRIDYDRITAVRVRSPEMESIEAETETRREREREASAERALEQLVSDRPDRRVRGLKQLRHLGAEDLFEWCVMCVDDPEVSVRVAAIEVMRDCEDAEPDMVEPFVDDEDRLLRAAALSFMTKHGERAEDWFRAGLTDPEPHVRVTTARHLDELDSSADRSLFELALYDPNPKVAEAAGKMTEGRGYHVEKW